MRIRNIKKNQLAAWLFAGLSAPVAQIAGGMPWQTVALIAGACLSVCWLLGRMELAPAKWLCIIEYVWLVCLLGSMASWISDSWTAGAVYPAVPLILLVLGGASAFRGTENGARTGSTLFWLIGLVYVGVIVAGAGEVDPRELAVRSGDIDARLIAVLLIPCLTVFLKEEEGKLAARGLLGIFIFAVLVSVLVTGALSLPVAADADAPLHEWVEGLSLAGTLQRFEAVVSMALTMGWFVLLSHLIVAAGRLTECVKAGAHSKGCWAAVAGAGVLVIFGRGLSPTVLAVGCVLLWVAVPAVWVLIDRNKNIKIFKNNA